MIQSVSDLLRPVVVSLCVCYQMQRAGRGPAGPGPGAGPGPPRAVRGLLQLRDPRAAEPLRRLQHLQEVSQTEAEAASLLYTPVPQQSAD